MNRTSTKTQGYLSRIEMSYDWLAMMLYDCRRICDKACGCGNCDLAYLEEFAFGDHSVYHIE